MRHNRDDNADKVTNKRLWKSEVSLISFRKTNCWAIWSKMWLTLNGHPLRLCSTNKCSKPKPTKAKEPTNSAEKGRSVPI